MAVVGRQVGSLMGNKLKGNSLVILGCFIENMVLTERTPLAWSNFLLSSSS